MNLESLILQLRFQFLSGFQQAKFPYYRSRKSVSFQFLSGFQSSENQFTRMPHHFPLSIPFRIPVSCCSIGLWCHRRLSSFNSFPDSSAAIETAVVLRTHLSIPFRIPDEADITYSRRVFILSIPFRIPVQRIPNPHQSTKNMLSIPFRIPEEEVEACASLKRFVNFQFLSGFQKGVVVGVFDFLTPIPFNSFPDSSYPQLFGGWLCDVVSLSIPFRIPEFKHACYRGVQ